MNQIKKVKMYLLVTMLLTCVPTSHVMSMQKIKALFSKLAQKIRKNKNHQVNNQNEQQNQNIPLPNAGNNAQIVTLIESIKTFVDEKPLVIEVKMTQTEQLEKDLEELEAAENFKLALKELKKQLEPQEKNQNSPENNNKENASNKILIIDENDNKNNKEEHLTIENNNNQIQENNALTHLTQELGKMKKIENNELTDKGDNFGKKLIEVEKNNLPIIFSDLVTFLLTQTKKK